MVITKLYFTFFIECVSFFKVEEIAEHISIIDRAAGEDSNVRKVSLASCSLGGD
jgi:hypothetical protein